MLIWLPSPGPGDPLDDIAVNDEVRRRAVFLDRDGVINEYVHHPEHGTMDSPAHPDELVLLPGAAEAVARLNRLGLLVIVTTNQPGIAKGEFTPAALEKITEKMAAAMAAEGARIDAVCSCLHHPEAVLPQYRLECGCRKPKPGLLLDAGVKWNLDLARSYMVGDGISDVLAGQAAGVTTLFVGSRKCYLCDELARQGAQPRFVVGTLSEAAEVIAKVEAGEIRSPAYGSDSSRCPAQDPHSAYPGQYIGEAIEILKRIDQRTIARTLELLIELRERGGRLFLLGVGGGAGHASHAVCDFRKIAQIEAYTPSDNVSELTARVNDEGWDTAYACWLRSSRLTSRNMVFVLSVGGGDAERNISDNLVKALEYAKEVGATICGVVGRDGGFTAKVADACVVVPVVNPATITPRTESFQALIWHLLVSHPKLKASEMKWETVQSQTKA